MRPEILLDLVDLVLQSEAVRRSPKKQQQNFLLLQSNRPSKTREVLTHKVLGICLLLTFGCFYQMSSGNVEASKDPDVGDLK